VHEDAFIGLKSNPARLPFNHEAAEFSVEYVWHPNPTGMHKPLNAGRLIIPMIECFGGFGEK
jgi:hypothetical protein